MANEKLLIDVDAARRSINRHLADVISRGTGVIQTGKDSCNLYEFTRGYEEGAKVIANLVFSKGHLVDAVEVVHGRWRRFINGDGEYKFLCSVCEKVITYEMGGANYCPNCGAKMDGGTKDE